jgi:cytochrome P450
VNDPDFMDTLYGTAGKRRDKYKITIRGLGTKISALATLEHDLHRKRRAPLNPFFSKQSVRRLDPVLKQTVSNVLRNLSNAAKTGKIMGMDLLYAATTSDIIYEYCFGKSERSLDREDLNEPYFAGTAAGNKQYHFATFNPWYIPTLKALPVSAMVVLIPLVKQFLRLTEVS